MSQFQTKIKPVERGYSLTEVLVGMLILFSTATSALQAMVTTIALKVKAQETTEAINWVQEDLENIRYLASQLDFDGSTYTANSNRCSATDEGSGYADLLRDDIQGLEVSNNSDPNNAEVINKNSRLENRSYRLTRTTSVADTSPYNILQLSYTVASSDGSPVLSQYVEVIPDVTFACE